MKNVLLSAEDVKKMAEKQLSDEKSECILFFKSYLINYLNSKFQLAIETDKSINSISTNFLSKELTDKINKFQEVIWLLEVVNEFVNKELPKLGYKVIIDNTVLYKETYMGNDFLFYKISW